VETNARISEITSFFRFVFRERAGRERLANRDWAYSGGW
jgi:hypothetical protein